jgi:tRNA threonylcarbamoyladenosine biosynthesis protein TsaB
MTPAEPLGTTALGPADLLLCLDTSTPAARVAVIDGTGTVRFAAEATADRHSSHVLALCAQVLEAAGLAPAGLAGIAVGGGPGSFTGLRVGLAVAKGLAMPTGVPLYLVSSLEALALDIVEAIGREATAVPCLDAGKGEVYVGAFVSDGERLVREARPACRLPAAEVGPWLAELARPALAGNGTARHGAALGAPAALAAVGPSARSIGRLALLQRARGEAADLERAVPFYGRPPDITVKKPRA